MQLQTDTVLSLIVAMTPERVIGRNGALPWRLPSDLARFRRLTTGHPIIMGRSTWESLPPKARPLPDRTSIVVTRQAGYQADGAIVANSVGRAYTTALRAYGAREIFVIGGEAMYRGFMSLAGRAYVTKVHSTVKGDAHFPDMRAFCWRQEEMPSEPRHPDDEYTTSFHIYERVIG